jgi:branched-chain amino acid transport system permease protein
MLGQLVVNGIAGGGIYALLAVGFALIYNTSRVLHLAHSIVYTFGAYAFYVLTVLLGLWGWASAPIAVVLTGVFGWSIEACVYRPLRRSGAGHNATLIATLGLISMFQGTYALVFSTDDKMLRQGPLPVFQVGNVTITILHIAIITVSLVVFPVLQVFLTRTRLGIAIRALADNRELADIQGMETDKLYGVIFLLGSSLAGIAAVLTALDLGATPDMGFDVVFAAVVALVIGGVGYLPGALVGAFALGLAQQLVVWKLNTAWQSGLVFTVLILFLILRPQGFFGARLATRQV